jgi:phospholipase D1/2
MPSRAAPRPVAAPPLADGDIDIHITAAEAYPAFERAVLAAREEIVAGFRIFDMSTTLRSPEARAIGTDWFDLLLHALRRGVALRLVLSDFDPVVGTELHGETWRTLRAAAALSELAGPEAHVDVVASLHPAQIGGAARLALWPRVHGILSRRASEAMRDGDEAFARFLGRHPRLSQFLVKIGARVRPRFWPLPQLWPITHHQKAAAIDGRLVYLGGLDLNDRRWDGPEHDRPAVDTWHDVQVSVRDAPTAEAVRTHLSEFTRVIEGEAEPSDLGGRILRTLSARMVGRPSLLAPRPVLAEIEGALLDAIGQARHLIYIETQYLRDRRVARAVARAGRANPRLQVVVILPAAPEDVAFFGAQRSDARFGEFLQASCIRRLRRAFRGRIFIGSPARPVTAQGAGRDVLHGAPIIYVHAKVCTIDDEFGLVGSANLNGRSMRWDTELAIPFRNPDTVRRLRRRCMTHLLGDAVETRPGLLDPKAPVGHWQRLALDNARRRPEERDGFILPHLSRPSRRFGQDLKAVPDEMV